LKAVLFHSGNKFPSIPLVHAVHVKETYENLRVLLHKIRYGEHRWNMYGDLKVVAMLTGLQGGYTKFCCFTSNVNGTANKGLPLQNKIKPLLSEAAPGQKNVAHPALVDRSKIYLLPLHIKLGLIKIFVKTKDK
jgi:hypothetical protein